MYSNTSLRTNIFGVDQERSAGAVFLEHGVGLGLDQIKSIVRKHLLCEFLHIDMVEQTN